MSLCKGHLNDTKMRKVQENNLNVLFDDNIKAITMLIGRK